jgi:hypothetical protein
MEQAENGSIAQTYEKSRFQRVSNNTSKIWLAAAIIGGVSGVVMERSSYPNHSEAVATIDSTVEVIDDANMLQILPEATDTTAPLLQELPVTIVATSVDRTNEQSPVTTADITPAIYIPDVKVPPTSFPEAEPYVTTTTLLTEVIVQEPIVIANSTPEVASLPAPYELLDCSQLTASIKEGMNLEGIANFCSPAFNIDPTTLRALLVKYNPQILDPNNLEVGTLINLTEQQAADPSFIAPIETPPTAPKNTAPSGTLQERCDNLGGIIVTITGPTHVKDHLLSLGITPEQANSIMFRENNSYLQRYGLENPIMGQKVCMGTLEALKAYYYNTLS